MRFILASARSRSLALRLVLAILVAFIFIFATDFLIHGFWLKADYAATKELWRTEPEMNARFPWLLGAQFLVAIAFVTTWALGFARRGSVGLACAYGLLVGVLVQATTIISYVVSPLPPEIALKWIASGLVQSVALAVSTFVVYKPMPSGAGA